ncbi:MAG: hypothetical protein LBQ38_01420 [Spirochaetaceae bacterium]|jgi:hypothetical protein|nr:hypothetical protein [Spirochaetaceae bacterium]
MFRKKAAVYQGDMCKGAPAVTRERSRALYEDPEGWHNRFRRDTTNGIDGEVFKPLFAVGRGAPVESTYYLFRKRIADYRRESGKDLMGQVFRQLTKEQCLEFGVGGKAVRMDRTLIGSDIGWYSRYGVVHETIRVVYGKQGSEQKRRRREEKRGRRGRSRQGHGRNQKQTRRAYRSPMTGIASSGIREGKG